MITVSGCFGLHMDFAAPTSMSGRVSARYEGTYDSTEIAAPGPFVPSRHHYHYHHRHHHHNITATLINPAQDHLSSRSSADHHSVPSLGSQPSRARVGGSGAFETTELGNDEKGKFRMQRQERSADPEYM